MSEPPYPVLLRTASMMRKRAQHEVLHIVLTFLIGREKVIFSIRRHSFHHTKGEGKNEPHACGITIRPGWCILALLWGVRTENFGISAVTAVLYAQDSVRSPPRPPQAENHQLHCLCPDALLWALQGSCQPN